MVPHAIHSKHARRRTVTKDRWASVCSDDRAGIDGDIEGLIGSTQKRLGVGRGKALSELVRSLSRFAECLLI